MGINLIGKNKTIPLHYALVIFSLKYSWIMYILDDRHVVKGTKLSHLGEVVFLEAENWSLTTEPCLFEVSNIRT